MSYVQERYRETIDYTWALARQLDRIAEARSKLHGKVMRAEYERRLAEYRSTVYTLYMLLPPRARQRLPDPKGYSLRDLDNWVAEAIGVLDKLGLLIRKRETLVGGDASPGDI